MCVIFFNVCIAVFKKILANQNFIISKLESLDQKVSNIVIDASHAETPEGWPDVLPLTDIMEFRKWEAFLNGTTRNFDFAVSINASSVVTIYFSTLIVV